MATCAVGYKSGGEIVMALGLGLRMGLTRPAASVTAGGGAAYHPDDDGAGADMYILAGADDITESGTGVDTWAWRNTGSTNIYKQGTDANRPSYNATGVLSKPCVTFNGTSDVMLARNAADSADIPVSAILAAGGIGAILCVFATSAVTSTSATAYDNDTILGDDSGVFGLVLHKTGVPVYSFRTWAWDGTADKADTTINLNTGYVGMWRKPDTSTLYSSVNGGSETSVASGTVSTLTAGLQLGDGVGEEFTGELYCIMAWKSAPADIADIISRLMTYYGIS